MNIDFDNPVLIGDIKELGELAAELRKEIKNTDELCSGMCSFWNGDAFEAFSAKQKILFDELNGEVDRFNEKVAVLYNALLT